MVYGHSMEPFLTYGENVTIVPCGSRLKKAHCYAYISGNSLMIHRFIRRQGTGTALFAGDNSHFLDRVPMSSVVGELSACQNPGILFIIQCINDIFSTLMILFHDVVLISRSRRFLIRVLITLAKRGGCNEKKI